MKKKDKIALKSQPKITDIICYVSMKTYVLCASNEYPHICVNGEIRKIFLDIPLIDMEQ